MDELIVKTLPGIITAILASYLAARWSLHRLYSEKWWQRREHAYAEIIDALYDLLQYCEIKKEDYSGGDRYSEDKMKEFSQKYSQAYWKIKKVTDIGAFSVSPETAKILETLRERPKLIWEENPPWEIYEQDYDYYKEALNQIVEAAKKDLKA